MSKTSKTRCVIKCTTPRGTRGYVGDFYGKGAQWTIDDLSFTTDVSEAHVFTSMSEAANVIRAAPGLVPCSIIPLSKLSKGQDMSNELGPYHGERNTKPRKAITPQQRRKRDAIGRDIKAQINSDSPVVYDAETGKVRDDSGTITRLFYGKDGRLRMRMYSLDYFRRPCVRLIKSAAHAMENLEEMF